MKSKDSNYWFPAKAYGVGWGLPVTWQGWAILLVYIAAMIVTAFLRSPTSNSRVFIGLSFAYTIALIIVCYIKGERLNWRWGSKQ